MSEQCTEEYFLRDVKEHEMQVIKDDGVYRHVRFKNPGTSCMFFDLITWPGSLCYTGDMGTYVFTRLEDMFEFFRTDREYALKRGQQLSINKGYWAEKLQAADKSDGVTKFSDKLFEDAVLVYLKDWMRSRRDETTKEERRSLWESVTEEVLNADSDSDGYRKQIAAHDFSHFVNSKIKQFYFQDFFEYNVTEYTFRFVWCCYAIAWGIQQYDNAKEKVGVEA